MVSLLRALAVARSARIPIDLIDLMVISGFVIRLHIGALVYERRPEKTNPIRESNNVDV
jgi:hypothetical protein